MITVKNILLLSSLIFGIFFGIGKAEGSLSTYLCDISPEHCLYCEGENCPPKLKNPYVFCCDPDSVTLPCYHRPILEACPDWMIAGECFYVDRATPDSGYCYQPG